MKTISPKEIEDTDSIPSHILQSLRDLGVFGARIHEDYNGKNLLNSEFLQILETVSKVPALGLFLLKQGVPPIDIFNKYASVEQKLRYLPKIATGQSLASVAVTEKESGPAAQKIDTTAVASMCDNYWVLDGEKIFVPNANVADTFLVFAHAMQSGTLEKRPETLACFIVDSNSEGLTVSQDLTEMIGARGFKNGRLVLKDVKIPKENLIGEVGSGAQQMSELFTHTRHFVGALTISILKNLLNQLTTDVMRKKHFDQNFYEIKSVQDIFAKLHGSIYVMESMLYLTTSIIDIYDNPDVLLETALVEQYCVQECMTRLQESMQLVGPKACTTILPYEQFLRDAFTVTNYETSLIDTKIYNALLGIHHCGMTVAEEIKKSRNPLQFPAYALRNIFSITNFKNLGLHLEEHVHPSLRECAELLDRTLYKLKDSTQTVLLHHGMEVSDQHCDLQRVSDIAALCYAYISILSRASRSYCIGNRDSDSEIKICMVLAYRLEQRIKTLSDEISVSEYTNGDMVSRQVAQLNFEKKDYFAAHPLQRNY